MQRLEQVLLGDVEPQPGFDQPPDGDHGFEIERRRGFAQHRKVKLVQLGEDGEMRLGFHREHHEIRLRRGEFGIGRKGRCAPLRRECRGFLRVALHHAHQLEPLRQLAGDAREELGAPAAADQAEADRRHQAPSPNSR